MNQNEIAYLGPRNVRPFAFDKAQTDQVMGHLNKLGINLTMDDVDVMFQAYKRGHVPMLGMGQDAALTAPLTTPSITTPIQFLQEWLPGFVHIITQARKIDELVGISTQGRWEDEEIVQGLMEYTGNTQVYGDLTKIPLSSWNVNFERRTVVRFEEGLQVGRLEEARAAAMRANSAEAKRGAAAEALEITRNSVGFFGYNNGTNRTYGFLNDPQLPAYANVPNGAGGNPEWSTKTYLEITGDIREAFSALRQQSGDTIDPGSDAVTLAIATDAYDYLSVTSTFGNSVRQWLTETYPNTRVISVPELTAANAGDSVFYLYAESAGAQDSSTDDRRTFIQVVPTKMQSLGVEQKSKLYVEDYSNATAGVMCKRPYLVVRRSGI